MLMQPVFIRVIDNLRKELDQSIWQGNYREETVWADSVPLEMRSTVMELRQRLKTADPSEVPEIEASLAHLPQPYPGYQLYLQHDGQQVVVDVWQLCYQVCFKNYNPVLSLSEEVAVEVDPNLIDATGDVDWLQLDEKAKQVIQQIFQNLPTA